MYHKRKHDLDGANDHSGTLAEASVAFDTTTGHDHDGTDSKLISATGIVPVGAVLPWLKTYTNTPGLPAQFVECNGQVLDDGDSVYDGQTIPDLNGDNRFMRGAATSGGTGGASTNNLAHTHAGGSHTLITGEMPAHTHNIYFNANLRLGSSGSLGATLESVKTGDTLGVTSTGGDGAHSHGNTDSKLSATQENKPPYYDVVWIMRIK